MDESRITQWQAALSRSIASRRVTLARLIGVPLGLTLLQISQTESDAKGKKKKKKKKKGKGKGKNKGGNGGTSPPPTSPPPGGGNGAPLDSEESAFLTQINAYRAANGQGALAANAQLNAAADGHSVDMVNHNTTGHTGSDGSGPQQRIERAGYVWSTWGENVFWGSASAQDAFTWWKNSPDHNANMLSPNFTEIGIGRAYNASAQYGWYWTTVFGKP